MKDVRENTQTQSLLVTKHAWEPLDQEICMLCCQKLLWTHLVMKTVRGNTCTVLAINNNSQSVNQCVPSIAGYCGSNSRTVHGNTCTVLAMNSNSQSVSVYHPLQATAEAIQELFMVIRVQY
jgi:hypothetical protein